MAASGDDLATVLRSVCSEFGSSDDTNCTELLKVAGHLRLKLLGLNNDAAPAVLKNDVIFRAVFCFLLDQRRAVNYLEELGRTTAKDWSSVYGMEPLELAGKVREQSTSDDDLKTTVVVVFLSSALRLSTIMAETLQIAKDARTQKALDAENRFRDTQKGLNKAMVSCVHLGMLLHRKGEAVCADQARLMFAGLSIVAQLLYDHGYFDALDSLMKSQEATIELAGNLWETVLDLRTDVSEAFLPKTIQILVAKDPELSPLCVPYRMYYFYLYIQLARQISGSEETWRVDQHCGNANHYCADNGRIYHGGRYDFISWLLYGLSLFDSGEYGTAKKVLEMDHLKPDVLVTSRMAAECVCECTTHVDEAPPKQHLLYFSDISAEDSSRELTAWHSIYDDPAVRKYAPRHIPDYARICRRLMQDGDGLPRNVVQSLFLASVGPLIDLAYQPKKPTKVVRSDTSVTIYGGSVNENLDLQSHVDVAGTAGCAEEVPDIDMMMAVTPAQLGLHVRLETSASSPRYAYLVDVQTDQRMSSFELLADAFPIAWNKVAQFVVDTAFVRDYEILASTIHGPAIATTIRRGSDTVLSYDHVPAFWIKWWPVVADEWRSRPRKYGWPSPSTVEDIVSDGVLLVAACHAGSLDPLNEWRASFSIAERTLVDTLSSTQRLVYLYAKLIWAAFLKPSFFLVSFHLKNALLWLCEERPPEFWSEENLVACVGEIFRWLRQEVGSGHLRNYFIAADSMIPVTTQSTDELLRALDDIIDNVFERILEADDKLRHIALLGDLSLSHLAESVRCCHLTNAAESIIVSLKQYVATLSDDFFDNRVELLDRLSEAPNA